jgi:phosphopantetheinyl transferase
MSVIWRYAAIDAICREAQPAEAWLAPRERQRYAGLGDRRRRCEWLAGRIMAKRLVSERLGFAFASISPARIEIDSGDGRSRRLRPRVLVDDQPFGWRLSIAHSGRSLLVALASSGQLGVGVDLVEPVDCGRGFAEFWFTPRERCWLTDPRLWPVAWAIKEAAYKATNCGEAFRPRTFEVLPAPSGGFACLLRGRRPGVLRRLSVWRTPCDETAILALYDGDCHD